MTDKERIELVNCLEAEACAMARGDESYQAQYPLTAKLLRQAATRIRADGLRMKAMVQVAITFDKELEATIARGLEKST